MTLVELLLAVALFSALLAVVAALVQTGLLAQVGWGKALEPYQQMERALGRMEQDLESAQPFFGIPVVGQAARFELARVDQVPSAEGPPTPDWVRVVYRMEDEVDGRALLREAFVWREGSEAKPFRRELLLRVADGRFAFGGLDAQQRLIWGERDEKARGVPRLVKFDGTLPAMNGRSSVTVSRIMRNPAGQLPTVEAP